MPDFLSYLEFEMVIRRFTFTSRKETMLVSHSCVHYIWFVNSVSLCPEDLTSRKVSRMIYFKKLFKLLEDLYVSKKTPLVCKSSQVFWTQNHYLPGP